jgi:hypothetical protein
LDAQNPGATYLWSNGSTIQTIEITAPGSYSVQVTNACGIGTDTIIILPCSVTSDCSLFDLGDTLTVCGNDTVQLQADLSSFVNVIGLTWTGGAGTFIPSNTVAAPRYVPTSAERVQGFVNLSLQVNATSSVAGQGGKLIAYDHSGEDLIFYISPLDGSIDTIQSNTGKDWTAMGVEAQANLLHGMANIVSTPALSNINIETGSITNVTTYANRTFYAGEYDNQNGVFYVIGMPAGGANVDQILYRVNTQTGVLDSIGNLNLSASDGFLYASGQGINGLAYDPVLNVLFGITDSGTLLRIDVNDGSAISKSYGQLLRPPH